MREVKEIIAENLVTLRRANGFTQTELAEKLNYSDKAISKWENGESLPGIEVICELCALYSVSLDYIVTEHGGIAALSEQEEKLLRQRIVNRLAITLLAVLTVWFAAVTLYVNLLMSKQIHYWMAYLWAVPASAVILIIFNAVWGKHRFSFTLVSILIWSVLVCIYLQIGMYNMWPIFLMGVPLQIAIFLGSNLKPTFAKKEPPEKSAKAVSPNNGKRPGKNGGGVAKKHQEEENQTETK